MAVRATAQWSIIGRAAQEPSECREGWGGRSRGKSSVGHVPSQPWVAPCPRSGHGAQGACGPGQGMMRREGRPAHKPTPNHCLPLSSPSPLLPLAHPVSVSVRAFKPSALRTNRASSTVREGEGQAVHGAGAAPPGAAGCHGPPHALVLSAVPSAAEVATPAALAAWPAAEPWALPPPLAEPSTVEEVEAVVLVAMACERGGEGVRGGEEQ